MKRLLLFVLLFPVFAMAQTKTAATGKQKTTTKSVANVGESTMDKFVISGTVTGYPDGTTVSLLNGNNGAPESVSEIQAGKFSFSGESVVPSFKLISLNNEATYITLFLDNSKVNIKAEQGKLEAAVITGSPSHKDFQDFLNSVASFQGVFTGEMEPTEDVIESGTVVINNFINSHPKSHITPLAVYRNFQLSGDEAQLEKQYNSLTPLLQNTEIGVYIAKQVADNGQHPIGKPFANFSQEDTAGVPVELASFRGKYVLVDFWASWCRPCRMENPNVVNAFNQYKNKNFTVLGVSLDQAKPAWIDAIKMDNLTWTQVSDLKGWGNEVAAKYGVGSIPQNFLVDPNGILVGKNLRGAALDRKLAKLIK